MENIHIHGLLYIQRVCVHTLPGHIQATGTHCVSLTSHINSHTYISPSLSSQMHLSHCVLHRSHIHKLHIHLSLSLSLPPLSAQVHAESITEHTLTPSRKAPPISLQTNQPEISKRLTGSDLKLCCILPSSDHTPVSDAGTKKQWQLLLSENTKAGCFPSTTEDWRVRVFQAGLSPRNIIFYNLNQQNTQTHPYALCVIRLHSTPNRILLE